MKKDIHISIRDIVAREKNLYTYGKEFAIIYLLGNKQFDQNEKVLLNDAVSFLFTYKGTAHIQVNEVECTLAENSIIDILDTDIVQHLSLSPRFEGLHILISVDFLSEVMRNTQKKEIGILLNRMDFLYLELTEEEAGILRKAIEEIQIQLKRDNHFDHHELLKSYIKIFLLEFLNIAAFHRKSAKATHSNKEEFVARFTHLLNENCCDHHEVKWYANELCIDTTYLSRILKSINGKTANQWIDDAIARKAKLYLMDENASVKDIADKLNFSDQAAFGKFFKKQEGLSPINYRRTLLLEKTEKSTDDHFQG